MNYLDAGLMEPRVLANHGKFRASSYPFSGVMIEGYKEHIEFLYGLCKALIKKVFGTAIFFLILHTYFNRHEKIYYRAWFGL